jgi:predicted phage-related endonuclease
MENELITMTEQGVALLSMDVATQIADFERKVKDIKDAEEKLKEAIKAEMVSKNVIKLETSDLVITYVAPTTSERLDSKALKAELPEIYDTYAKVSKVKDSIRVKVK